MAIFLREFLDGDELLRASKKKRKNFLTEGLRASKSPRRFSATEKVGNGVTL